MTLSIYQKTVIEKHSNKSRHSQEREWETGSFHFFEYLAFFAVSFFVYEHFQEEGICTGSVVAIHVSFNERCALGVD